MREGERVGDVKGKTGGRDVRGRGGRLVGNTEGRGDRGEVGGW